MKIKISMFFLMVLLMFTLSGLNISANSNISSSGKNQKTYLKSGEHLINDFEQMVVEHSDSVELEYYVSGISSISDMILSYETSNKNISINLEQTSSKEFSVSLMSNAIGENSVEVSCLLNLNDGNQVILKDDIFIYSREDYDFISKASILDAKFYCYTYITNTDNPTFEDFDEFYSTNNIENIISTNISNNLSIEDKATIMSMDNINVSGTITWVDEDGRSHNASNVTVEIIDEDILGINHVLETVTTNDLGQYNASVSNSSFLENGGNDIKLRVSTQGGNIKVVNNAGAVYKVTQTDPYMNYTGTYLYLDFEIDADNYSDDGDKERAYAFRVHQAMNLGAEYVETKKGNKLDTIKVKFPTTKSTSCYNGTKIFILEEDKNDWDVMLHEYGHYVSDYYNIDDSPGGNHSLGECLNLTYGKNDGMNLSWGEGWPTYFSISAQLEMNASTLNITNVGDKLYSDTDDANFSYSLETPIYDYYEYGESNEVAISAVLFDLADEKNDENIHLGYTFIWQLICNNQCKDFSEFVNVLYSEISNTEILELGEILSMYDISPNLTSPSNSSSGWNIPTFRWNPQGGKIGSSDSYENNLFTILFYDRYKNLIYESSQITSTSYTPSELEWIKITSNTYEYLYWCVKGYQTTDFITGGYYSDYRKLYLATPENIILDSNAYDNVEEDGIKWYKFVAPMKGTYVFETISEYDTYGELFSTIAYNNSTTNILINDDDDGEGLNFKIEYELEYKQVVYLRVRGYGYNAVDNYSLSIVYTYHEHEFEYEPVDSQYHILECYCGETSGSQSRHVIDGTYIDPIGNGRFKPCAHCGAAIDTWAGGIYPVLNNNNQVVYVMYENRIGDNEILTMDIENNYELMNLNYTRYTLNGSYMMDDGTIVLVEEDLDSYINGTLIFYNNGFISEIE